MADLSPQILTGVFTLCGAIGGVVLTGLITRGSEKRKVIAEDQRRWLADRRKIYASFLVLSHKMLHEIDGIAVFLSYDGSKAIEESDEEMIKDRLLDYHMKWDDEMNPALLEVQLIATPHVSDLADRMTSILMDLTAPVELRDTFLNFTQVWFKARGMYSVLMEAMRVELGLPENKEPTWPKTGDWPWLPDRPPQDASPRSRRRLSRPRPSKQ